LISFQDVHHSTDVVAVVHSPKSENFAF
jgi:hypothetical protein